MGRYIGSPEIQNRPLEVTSLVEPHKSRGSMGMGLALAWQEAAGGVFGQGGN